MIYTWGLQSFCKEGQIWWGVCGGQPIGLYSLNLHLKKWNADEPFYENSIAMEYLS